MDSFVTRNFESKSSKNNRLKGILFIFTGLIVIAAIVKVNSQQLINPVIESHALSVKEIKTEKNKGIPIAELKEKVNNEINTAEGTYSVYFYDLITGDNFGINEEMILTAASVNKIPILAALYYYAEKGVIDLDKMITLQASDIQDYGTGSIRYDKPGTSYSIKTLARLMMEKSDNTAAYLLASEIIGLSEIQKLAEDWGMSQTNINDNKSSVRDIFSVLNKMYKGEITSPELTLEMLGFMDDSDFEDRIPKGIPPNITVIHKTGNEVGNVHDAGIIDLPDRPYYLGVMTTDITNEEETKKKIARISQIVFSEVASL